MALLYSDPTNKIDNSCIPPAANIDDSKINHRARILYNQIAGSDPTAGSCIVFRAYAGAKVLAANVTPIAVPAGGTKTMTVDIQKSTGAGAFATILSSTTTLDRKSVV